MSAPKSFLLLVDYSFVILSVRKYDGLWMFCPKCIFVFDYAQ